MRLIADQCAYNTKAKSIAPLSLSNFKGTALRCLVRNQGLQSGSKLIAGHSSSAQFQICCCYLLGCDQVESYGGWIFLRSQDREKLLIINPQHNEAGVSCGKYSGREMPIGREQLKTYLKLPQQKEAGKTSSRFCWLLAHNHINNVAYNYPKMLSFRELFPHAGASWPSESISTCGWCVLNSCFALVVFAVPFYLSCDIRARAQIKICLVPVHTESALIAATATMTAAAMMVVGPSAQR